MEYDTVYLDGRKNGGEVRLYSRSIQYCDGAIGVATLPKVSMGSSWAVVCMN